METQHSYVGIIIAVLSVLVLQLIWTCLRQRQTLKLYEARFGRISDRHRETQVEIEYLMPVAEPVMNLAARQVEPTAAPTAPVFEPPAALAAPVLNLAARHGERQRAYEAPRLITLPKARPHFHQTIGYPAKVYIYNYGSVYHLSPNCQKSNAFSTLRYCKTCASGGQLSIACEVCMTPETHLVSPEVAREVANSCGENAYPEHHGSASASASGFAG